MRNPLDRRPLALAHADILARDAALDMTAYWSVTGPGYLAQVTKAPIIEAVAEGASAEAASKLADFKKPAMVEAAEGLLSRTGWLPPLLRSAPVRDEGADADDGRLSSPRVAA